MKRLLAAALALGLGAPAAAAPEIPQRQVQALVYGKDDCPKATEGEIVVCARKPENERYRIPKALREKQRRTDPPSTSWASRWAAVENATRFTMPNSCSVVGSGGQTGCTQAMIRQWWQERQAASSGR